MDQNHTDLAQGSEEGRGSAQSDSAESIDYAKLTQSLWYSEKQFKEEKASQGVVGQSFDFLKNNLGGSSESESWGSRVWSNVLSADNGSVAIEKRFEQTKNAVATQDKALVLPTLSVDTDGQTKLKVQSAAADYAESQRTGVGLAAEMVAMTAAGIGRGNLASSVVKGAFAKAGVKMLDGTYANYSEDLATGALLGLSVPMAGRIAESGAKVYTKLPYSLGTAGEGAMLGFAQGSTSNYETFRAQNKSIVESALRAPLETVAHPAPILLGGALGGVVGLAAKRAGVVESHVTSGAEVASDAAKPALDSTLPVISKPMVTAVLPLDTMPGRPIWNFKSTESRTMPSGRDLPAASSKLDAVGEYKLKATDDLSANSEKIANLVNSRSLTADELFAPVRLFPAVDAPVIQNILERAAMNSVDKGVIEGAASVHKVLRSMPDYNADLFTFAQKDTSGMLHAYLTRKSVGGGQSISPLDELSVREIAEDAPVIFDSPAGLSSVFKQKVQKAAGEAEDGTLNITFVDNSLFDKAPNVFDFALGQDAVLAKLKALNEGVKDALKKDPGLSSEDAVSIAIYGDFDQALKGLKEEMPETVNISVVRPGQIHYTHVLAERVTGQQVKEFFQDAFEYSSGEKAVAASKTVLQDTSIESFGQLVKDVQSLKAAVDDSARAKGLDPADDLYLLGHNDGVLASDGMMDYLAQRYAGVKPSQFVTREDYARMQNNPGAYMFFDDVANELTNKRLVVMDDAIYSGEQILDSLGSIRGSGADKVVATIASTSQFARRFYDLQLSDRGLARTDLLSVHTDLDDFFRTNKVSSRDYLSTFASKDDKGFNGLTTTRIMPQMSSDTTLNWLGKFAYRFLSVGNPHAGYPFKEYGTVAGHLELVR